jgi:V8-like Glu-specific endopeptidase
MAKAKQKTAQLQVMVLAADRRTRVESMTQTLWAPICHLPLQLLVRVVLPD